MDIILPFSDIFGVLNLIEPGLTMNRGRVLRQLHLPSLRLAKIRLQSGEAGKAEFMGAARRSVRNMKEAVRCFEDIDREIKEAGFD